MQKVYLFQEQRNVCKREIQRKSIQGKLRVALLQMNPERKMAGNMETEYTEHEEKAKQRSK